MKKIAKMLSAVVLSAVAMVVLSITAFAEDYVFDVSKAVQTSGAWAQSYSHYTALCVEEEYANNFNPTWMTSESEVIVTFEYTGTSGAYPCQLIWQTWDIEGVEPAEGINSTWNQVAPATFDDNNATYTYDDIVAAYGTSDFSNVYAICFGDTGNCLLVTSVTITNCDIPEGAVVNTASSSDEEEDAAEEEEAVEEAEEDEAVIEDADDTSDDETTEVRSYSSNMGVKRVITIVIASILAVVVFAVMIFFIVRIIKKA